VLSLFPLQYVSSIIKGKNKKAKRETDMERQSEKHAKQKRKEKVNGDKDGLRKRKQVGCDGAACDSYSTISTKSKERWNKKRNLSRINQFLTSENSTTHSVADPSLALDLDLMKDQRAGSQ